MAGRRATVWYGGARVGTLHEPVERTLRFSYEPSWEGAGFPISLSLPFGDDTGSLDAHFFSGLLPEGLSRQRVCREHRIEEDDDLGLLLTLGRDCAGALSVLPEGQEPAGAAHGRALTEDELVLLIESRGQASPESEPSSRFSLAGAQDKMAVRVVSNEYCLPDSESPSSHILKFETTRWVCFAESAGNELGRRVGLSVPEVTFTRHPKAEAPYLLVRRYDRSAEEDGTLRRVHQEDVLQALGLPPRLKYEDHGGPGLSHIAGLLRRYSEDPVSDIAALRDWQLFNYLAGNSDGHAKNVAFLYSNQAPVLRLSPAYDLVCIEFLNRLGFRFDRRLAFRIGDHNVPEEVSRYDWTAFAAALGIPAKRVLERLGEMASALPDHARDVRSKFADRFGDNQAFDRFEESIGDRCSWAVRSVFGRG